MPTSHRPLEKYNASTLITSSADRGWKGFLAELRSHDGGIIVRNAPLAVNEIVIDTRGDMASIVTRKGHGVVDRTTSRHGTVWLCPTGVQEDVVELSNRLPGLLHLYLEPAQFSTKMLGDNIAGTETASFRFERATRDPLITQIGLAILAELQAETPGGRLLVESLASSLAARMLQKYASVSAERMRSLCGRPDVGARRLRRVLDYVEANLESDISLDDMASIACLSRFHFARAFKAATGKAPHQYVSGLRMEKAKLLLGGGERSLLDTALSLGFSSQTTFTRAFRMATGQTPGQFAAAHRVSAPMDDDNPRAAMPAG